MSEPRLYLVDATGFCYRAYYALIGLSTSFGQPTNAVYGFVNFLNKILKQDKPEYLGLCFDVSRDTFRQRKFPEYKIQRPPAPEDLTSQIPIIKQIIQAYRITIYEKAGFEADDLIATLNKKAKGLNVVIVSSDKDMLQLVDEQTVVFNPYKDKGTIYDQRKIQEHFGIMPNQMVDFISLIGDLADNIPAVKGVGEKTAIRLMKDFNSIDELITNISKIKQEKLQKILKESIEQIIFNRSLIKLKDDIDLDFNLDKLELKDPDYPVLYKIFKQLEFKKFLNNPDFKDASLKSKINPHSGSPGKGINRRGEIAEFRNIKALVLAYPIRDIIQGEGDISNNGLYHNGRLAFLAGEEKIFTELQEGNLNDEALDIIGNPEIKKIGHDLKILKTRMAKRNIRLEGLYFDTMLAAYLLNPSGAGYSLADLSWSYFGEVLDSRNIELDAVCSLIFNLKAVLEKELKEKGLDSLFFGLEMPLVDVLTDMQRNGVTIDSGFLKCLSSQVEKELIVLVDKIYELSGTRFNINSPKQLRNILFEKLKLPVKKKTKSGASTNEEVLNILSRQHPLPKLLLEYRKLAKIKSTYIDALPLLVNPKTGRIHASFNQAGTQTGRLSSANPNLQNLPVKGQLGRQIRKAVIAAGLDAFLVSFDYSQIELRILAHLSQDPNLIEGFRNDDDIHVATASLIYGLDKNDIDGQMREVAKRINFGIIYGLSSYGLSRDLSISQQEAGSFIDAYFLRYPKVKDYIQSQIERARRDGYVMTILGRRRYLPEINSKNTGIRQFAERQAVNTPVQGSAADLIKKAMVDIYRRLRELGLESKLILQIHDELLFEVPSSELDKLISLVRKEMEGCFTFSVPIKVVVKKGKNWLETEEVK
ncbi:MAG: DNA polymerase I [Candidatus Omnitrophota bacterium]